MDLHVHTCLSPCADNGMVPTRIVDRPAFSLAQQQGFIPPELPLDAVELSWRHRGDRAPFRAFGFPLVSFSSEPSVAAMRQALRAGGEVW